MAVMSERTFITYTDSIPVQNLEFEKKLNALIQNIEILYHTSKPTLSKLQLIISRNQHSPTPILSVIRKLNQLFAQDTRPIKYISKELGALFPRDLQGQGHFPSSTSQSTPMPLGNSELTTGLTTPNNVNGNDGIGNNNNIYNETNGSTIGVGTRENMMSIKSITNNSESNSTSTMEHFDNNTPVSNTRTTIDISDVRSTPMRPEPIRRRPSTNMTLESESLQEILHDGDHTLAGDIYRHIGQHTTFQSFLELLNMYDTHLIDHVELLKRLVPFLGRNKALLERFKRRLLNDRMENNENTTDQSSMGPATGNLLNDADAASDVSAASSGTLTPFHLTVTQTTTNSPSYRWIPETLRNENCPGRDDTCWEVLNDEYVSHPTWASEDNGFLSSNKSKSEEMLHMVEDERYALDIDICIISDVLFIMEKYLAQLTDLPVAQQTKMNLYPEKDGCSTALYTQAIRKVYPRERRNGAIKQLHSSPFEMLPGFLKLMKQRKFDLKRQKHEKLQYWTDTVSKHYYRFLDYHYESNKSDARKIISVQHMVNEIDALWHEQQRQCVLHHLRKQSRQLLNGQSSSIPISSSTPTLLPPQLVYNFDDSAIISDTITLMRMSCHHQFHYGYKGTKAIDVFLSKYLPFFLGLPMDHELGDHFESVSPVKSAVNSGSGPLAVKTRSHGPQRRQLVGTQRNPQKPVNLERRVFIGNTTWYSMTRYFQMVYATLAHIKSIDQQYQISPEATKRNMSARVDLALESKAISSVTVDLTQGYYIAALEMMKAHIRGDLEQMEFEEGVRYLFGVQAYVSFNIGKMLPCLVRQVHQIMTSSKPSLDTLYDIFKTYQPCRLVDMHAILGYKYEMDDLLDSDENKFIMAIHGRKGRLSLQILGQHEAVMPQSIRNYIAYVDSFQQRKKKTVGVTNRKSVTKVFLKRNLEPENKRAPSKIFLLSNIRYEMDPQSYKLLFTEESEDVFIRQVINKKRKFGDLDSGIGGGNS